MNEHRTASEQITEEVTSWEGVEAGLGRRGEFAFKVGAREIGHLHGDHAAHFSFPKDVWADLKEQRRIVDHPVFPGTPGPAARRIENEADVRDVIELLRLNYDRVVSRHGLPAAAGSRSR
jgi:luciferase-like monooxygenase